MRFKILGRILDIQVIAHGNNIHEIQRVVEKYGKGRWRKYKGVARIEMSNGRCFVAEVHWYEAHGIGKKMVKVKRIL